MSNPPPEHGVREGWFGREEAPADIALTFECELGYTFDPAVWRQGFATEAACCVRDYARDVLRLSYVISAILPSNARSQRVAERSGAHRDGLAAYRDGGLPERPKGYVAEAQSGDSNRG